MPDPEMQSLEEQVHGFGWEELSFQPSSSWEEIEKDLPEEWLTTLEYDREAEFDQEVLEPLYAMSDTELQSSLDISEGDIDANARQAVAELDINVQDITQEIATPDINLPEIHDLDFGR